MSAEQGGFAAWQAAQLARVERALNEWMPAQAPAGLGEVMRYAVQGGGKRLRPLLALAACEAVEGAPQAALRAACAVELIHAYSLVHDDMPCMDNDVLRRGKPTVHVRFGQAQALLAGDALQALAFEILTPEPSAAASADIPADMQAALCRLLARAASSAARGGGLLKACGRRWGGRCHPSLRPPPCGPAARHARGRAGAATEKRSCERVS